MLSAGDVYKTVAGQYRRCPSKPDSDDGISEVVCCGDFQLAHSSVWETMRGFEQAMTRRAFADSNVMLKAKVAGFKTAKLCHPCYHLNHYGTAYDLMNKSPMNDKARFLAAGYKTTNAEDWGKISSLIVTY